MADGHSWWYWGSVVGPGAAWVLRALADLMHRAACRLGPGTLHP